MPESPDTVRPPERIVFHVGGFEAVGGIEAFLFDLLTNLPAGRDQRSMLVWAQVLPQFSKIERAGTRVFRTPLRAGCRFGLPDALLYARHGRQLAKADRIVFLKIPPEPLFTRIVDKARARRPRPTETVFVTAYRPRELWPEGMPNWVRRGFDRILVQSREFADDLREMQFTGPIDIVPYIPPVAAAAPVERPREDPFRLGFLGRFVPQKNLFYLFDIADELRSSGVELHLFGGGEHDRGLRDATRARDLPVTFHGVVPREAVAAAIDSCDAFINPSISEGQCLVALEVLSRGRPFIATGVGAIPEILGKGKLGRIIPLDDAAGAANIVRAFLAEWRAGEWRAGEIADAYSRAYPRAEIIGEYEKLL
jgi:glycosyltransferase involved in cell wall biosynthesis